MKLKPFLGTASFLFILFFKSQTVFAQNFSVQIEVLRAEITNYLGDEYGPRIRVYKDEWAEGEANAVWRSSGCIKLAGNIKSGTYEINRSYYTTVSASELPQFKLIIVTHEERKSGSSDCTAQDTEDLSIKHPDRYETSSTKTIYLNHYAPGVFSNELIFINTKSGTTVRTFLRIRYTPVPLVTPTGATGLKCADEPFVLTTSNNPNYHATNTTGLNYEWEYHVSGHGIANPAKQLCINDCNIRYDECVRYGEPLSTCYQQNSACMTSCNSINPYVDDWRPLMSSTSPSVSLDVLSKVFNDRLSTTGRVRFRVRARGAEISGTISEASPYFDFAPPAPKSVGTFASIPSCPGDGGTGVVQLNGITSQFSTYRYILRAGDVTAMGCDPDTDGCLPPGDISGSNAGGTLTISNVKANTYTLFLMNNAGTVGFCPRRIGTVTVAVIPDLKVHNFNFDHVTCHDAVNGAVRATINDGRYSTVSYKLENTTDGIIQNAETNTANAAVTMGSLNPGAYQMVFHDGCTPQVVKEFSIKQPAKISEGEFISADALCSSPGDGTANITVSRSAGTFDTLVSNTLVYTLSKNSVPHSSIESTTLTQSWMNSLAPGSYDLTVVEKGSNTCNALSRSFTIDPPDPLSIQVVNTDSVSCFNTEDGVIQVTAAGGSGNYIFELTGEMNKADESGNFSFLVPGEYYVTVRNNFSCNDRFTSPVIRIEKPDDLTVSLTAKDISCFGLSDGSINAAVTGGTMKPTGGTENSGYNYEWQTLINNGWIPLSEQSVSLKNRDKGDFRLRITDENACESLSNQVTIAEPPPIQLDSVLISDIRCVGEQGNLIPYSSGGVNGHIFSYSADGSIYTDFTANTPLFKGTYTVKVRDENNCSTTFHEPRIITAPLAALDFTEVLSDFNGFNISCYAGSNGYATLTPMGGNGNHYAGYQFAIDEQPFQQDPTLKNINAGSHIFSVRDGRGCIKTKLITFTQTLSQLNVDLLNKENVKCYGDETGVLEVSAHGGIPPYTFSIDGENFKTNGTFSALPVGQYSIMVLDKNKCETIYEDRIISISPAMEISATVKDVNCFDGNDGAINVSVAAGVVPYTYQWTGISSSLSAVSGLPEGDYIVGITDAAGCTREALFTVAQPLSPVAASLYTIPVCFGKDNGSISVTATGGTFPYQYSIDNGQTFQTENGFVLGAGKYAIVTRDDHGCIVQNEATIIQRNDQPLPNFLAATNRNALDTLILTEISVPKPDSIHWVFDENATVIDNDQWNPMLKFQKEGVYTVTMTGFFAGCDYSVVKSLYLNPYDPSIEKERDPEFKPIQDVIVSPNPSPGAFDVTVLMNSTYNVSIKVYDVLGAIHYAKEWAAEKEVADHVTMDRASSGVYVLRVVTERDAHDVRIIINK